ncbi:MAG: urease accessory protein UreD, partial [Pseudomonadota bacterium]
MTAVTDIAKRHTAQPRARGRAEIGARLRGGLSRLSDLRQEGSAKVLLPRATDPGLQAVILNTAGG